MSSFTHTGREDDDYRLITDTEEGRSIELNSPGAYPTCCVELTLDGLSINTVLQSQHINDYEGGSGTGISFDCTPQVHSQNCMLSYYVDYGAVQCSMTHVSILPFSHSGSKASLEELMEGGGTTLSVYDEAALCSSTFKSVHESSLGHAVVAHKI